MKEDKKSLLVTIGGSGYFGEPERIKMDAYVLSLSSKDRPKVCLLSLANGDDLVYIDRFMKQMSGLDCFASHLSFFRPTVRDIREILLKQDIIYLGEGSARNLSCLLLEWELNLIFEEALSLGIIIVGVGAGAAAFYKTAVTDSYPGRLRQVKGMGFLSSTFCPHFEASGDYKLAYYRLIKEGVIRPGIGLEDFVALIYNQGKLEKAVSIVPNKYYYKLKYSNEQISEISHNTELI